jgi:hypothetical protein
VNLWKTRSQAPGTALSDAQAQQRDQLHVDFWKPQDHTKKRKPRATIKQPPRLPTQDVMRMLDNALWQGLGIRLHSFKLTLERGAELLKMIVEKRVTLEALLTHFGWICVWADRASRQWTAMNYLAYHQKVLINMASDHPCHQHWNAALKGLRCSNHESTVMELCPMANWTAGPWGKSQVLSKSATAALELYVSVKAGDKLLMVLFPFIAVEQGLPDWSLETREKWILREQEKSQQRRSRSGGPSTITKGAMAKKCEWYGMIRILREKVLPKWHSWVLLLVYMCLMVGELRRAYELFELARGSREIPTLVREVEESTDEEAEGQGAAAAQAKAKGKAKAKAGFCRLPGGRGGRHMPKMKPKPKVSPKKAREQATSTLRFVLDLLTS